MARKLLIADDEPFSRKMVVEMVRDAWPHVIVPVSTGSDAMAELVGPGAGDVAALISDFNMPGVNGLQLLRAIRMGIEGIKRDLPVIMLTGHADKGLVATALALDVDAFLAKPVSKLTLREKLKRVLAAERMIKPVEAYAHIEVREDMLVHWKTQAATALPDSIQPDGAKAPAAKTAGTPTNLDAVNEGAILAASVRFPDGTVIVPAGRALNRALIDRLQDLRAIGHAIDPVWIGAAT